MKQEIRNETRCVILEDDGTVLVYMNEKGFDEDEAIRINTDRMVVRFNVDTGV